MTALIRHARTGVTLPGVWFDGAQKHERPKPQVKPIPQNATNQTKVFNHVTDEWRDFLTIKEASNMSEDAVRAALRSIEERGLIETRFQWRGKGKYKLYRRAAT